MFSITADELPRFMQCNGSSFMDASAPPSEQDDTVARDEGTAAHWLASVVFNKQHTIEELIDRKAPNGVYISPEMADHVVAYLDELLAGLSSQGVVEVDTSFEFSTWKIRARADHVWFNDTTNTLHVDDFKYGWRIADPVENWTLIAHAIGFCITRRIQPQQIVLAIYQPRPYHSDGKRREWRITWTELLTYYERLNTALCNPQRMLNTGPQCGKCHALATCPAAKSAGLNAIDTSEHLFNETMNVENLAFEIDTLQRAKRMLDDRLTALEEMAKHRIRSGVVIPNYSMEPTYGNRILKQGVTVEMLEVMTGKSLRIAKDMTPAQMEKAGVSKETVKLWSYTPTTGTKLVRTNANRKAEKIFGKKGTKG